MPPASATSSPVGRSCKECPSFLAGAAQPRSIGTNLNGPICGRRMLPLVMPSQNRDAQNRALMSVAKACSMYGENVTINSLSPDAAPDLSVGMDHSVSSSPPSPVENLGCFACKNFIPPSVVQTKTGWTAGICRASGSLVPDTLKQNYAASCGKFERQFGPRPKDPFVSFTFFPQYSDTFGRIDPTAAYKAALQSRIDPQKYETDRAVSPKMAKRGIRAWFRVPDPDAYGPDVFLPIFDVNFIQESQRDLVPKAGKPDHPEMYADHAGMLYDMAVNWIKLDEIPALWGPGGTGKTEFCRYLAWRMGLPFHRIVINGSSETDDLIGKILFKDGATVPHYGRLSRAWSSPSVLLLDEPNTGRDEVWQLFRPLFDNSKMLDLDSLEAERLRRHDDCYPVLAMNPSWHPLNVGAKMVGDADASRLVHMYFDYPPEPLEKEIIQRRLVLDEWQMPDDKMAALMRVARALREQSASGILHSSWGIRHQIKTARLMQYVPPVKAYRRALADMLDPAQMENVLTEVKSQFGE